VSVRDTRHSRTWICLSEGISLFVSVRKTDGRERNTGGRWVSSSWSFNLSLSSLVPPAHALVSISGDLLLRAQLSYYFHRVSEDDISKLGSHLMEYWIIVTNGLADTLCDFIEKHAMDLDRKRNREAIGFIFACPVANRKVLRYKFSVFWLLHLSWLSHLKWTQLLLCIVGAKSFMFSEDSSNIGDLWNLSSSWPLW